MIKKFIWAVLIGALPTLLFGVSYLDWQWWIYALIMITGAFWICED